MKFAFLFMVVFAFLSCNTSEGIKSGAAANLDGFITEALGPTVTRAYKKNDGGETLEGGYLTNGKRNGVWMTYYTGEHKGKVKTIASYTDGILSGPYYEFSNRGQIETEVNYANNEYNGKYGTYKFGREVNVSHYKNHKLDGISKDFDNKGNIQKEVNYKNGLQDGIMKYYDPEGNVTLEYVYKNGEKISGGMVEK